MNRRVRALILALGGSLLIAIPATAQAATKQLPNGSCSVTSTLTRNTTTSRMTYAGGLSCTGGVGQKTLDVVPQVRNIINGKVRWFNISLAGRYQGPTPVNPLRLRDTRAAVAGRVYRVLAYGRVKLPNGQTSMATACAGRCTGSPTLTITQTNRYAPQLPIALKIGASPCYVTEDGPVFTLVNGSYVMTYGGRVSCSIATLSKSLSISGQVSGSGTNFGTHYTINGSELSTGPSSTNPIALSTARTALLGHAYRVKASGTVVYNGTTYTASVYSRPWAP